MHHCDIKFGVLRKLRNLLGRGPIVSSTDAPVIEFSAFGDANHAVDYFCTRQHIYGTGFVTMLGDFQRNKALPIPDFYASRIRID